MGWLQHIMKMNFFLLLLLQWSFAKHQKVVPGYHSNAIRIPDIDIDQLRSAASLNSSMHQAIEMIRGVESLPTCTKLATRALMNSCSSLEGTIPHDEVNLAVGYDLFIEEEVDIYAARLALCELKGAIEAPKQCLRFVPTEGTAKKQGIREFSKNVHTEPTAMYQHYDEITLSDLDRCRSALGSTPQTWTSYSNNRQNAVILCRAMRSEIEKDQHIHLTRILSVVSASTAESLYGATQMSEQIKAEFDEISKSMRLFHQALFAENQEQAMAIQQFWTAIQTDVNQTHSVVKDVKSLIVEGRDRLKVMVDSAKSASQQLNSTVSEIAENRRHATEATTMELANLSALLESFGHDMLLQAALMKDQFVQFTHQVNYESFQRESIFNNSIERTNAQADRLEMKFIGIDNLTKSITENLHETKLLTEWLSNIKRDATSWLESTRAYFFTALVPITFTLVFRITLFMTRFFDRAPLMAKMAISGVLATCMTIFLFPARVLFAFLPIDCFWDLNMSWFTCGLSGAFLIGIAACYGCRYLCWTVKGQPIFTAPNLPLYSNTSTFQHHGTPKIRLPVNDPNFVASRLALHTTALRTNSKERIWQ